MVLLLSTRESSWSHTNVRPNIADNITPPPKKKRSEEMFLLTSKNINLLILFRKSFPQLSITVQNNYMHLQMFWSFLKGNKQRVPVPYSRSPGTFRPIPVVAETCSWNNPEYAQKIFLLGVSSREGGEGYGILSNFPMTDA